ncbi:hypothetical protein CLD22_22635 [Rubrivivax gelatinosus]|nr:hypothetical protein [Rubrivivax gelatinosus]
MKKIAMIAAVVLTCGAAQAQTNASPIYGEISYLMMSADAPSAAFDLAAVRGFLGYEVHPNIALEAMFAIGVADDRVGPAFDYVRLKLENSYGLYIKPKVNVTEKLELFARVGYAESKFKATRRGYGSSTDSDGDVSFGVGLKYTFAKNTYGAVDYMRYYDKDDLKVNGVTLGIGYQF